ncbi:P-loop containing nucleoside triphosphate hydrolase protein [Rhizoctonia solani]|nr:P-loop containing nucleoside triphosphate hydrolase protein [Rhizoctonia solani]
MAKKKKTSLKPVARPFATTSIARKVVEKPPEEIQEADGVEPENDKKNSEYPENPQNPDEEYDIDRAEIESLQLLVDQQQAKAEKDHLEPSSRTSKTFPRIDIDVSIRDRILELIKAVEPMPKLIQEPEVKVLPRLAVTYGTLRGLGLPENKIEECLKAIPDVDIDSAIEWLVLNYGEGELDFDNRLNNGLEPPPTYGATEIPQLVAQPIPSAPTTRSTNTPTRLATPAADISDSDSDSDTSLEVDVNTKWARTKVQLHMLKFGKPKSFKLDPNNPKVQRWEAKIRALESDYEFRKKHAEYTFHELRKVAEDDELKRSLKAPRTVPLVKLAIPVEIPKKPTTTENPTDPTLTAADAIDQHSDSDEGGFFGHMLDEMPTEVTTTAGDIVRVHTLEFPKSWNQATPKTLLKDYVTKLDTYALISYRPIGGVTRVARAAVQIRWRAKPGQEWIIPDACPTLAQAEEYAALLALHSLSAPVRAGFVGIRSTSVQVQMSSIGSLPPSARDLWKEFEVRRKREEDETNRRVWSTLRSIVEPKLAPPETYKTNQRGKSIVPANQDTSSATQPKAPLKEIPRNDLPIAAFRSHIIQSLQDNQVIVLSGETGCGKSTQLPAYIMEDQLSRGIPCRIYCTEPRRISAISLAQRVSRELGESPNAVGTLSSLIGYSVRLESNITKNTRLAFVTNGIALRMLESDGKGGTGFDEVTHIIIDEVHERSIESDFLLIVLKSMMKHRPDLKIVLMSATVDADKISAYFGGPNICPVLIVPGRTFPVKIQYLEDAVEFTKWTIDDDSPYALRDKKFSRNKSKSKRLEWSEETAPAEDDDEETPASTVPIKLGTQYAPLTISTINNLDERRIPYDLILRLLEKICLENSKYSQYSAAVLVFLPGLNEIRKLTDILGSHRDFGTQAFRIYPLHSSLPSESQTVVFDVPPPGVRKIVVSTNIAETGVTIPDITCVIDSGKHKEMRFDEKRQTSRLIETTIARSNAAQRRGRAGRVQEGLCFHLFTKSRHDNMMVDNPLPEILRLSLADLALRIKIMNVQIGSSIEDVLTRALDPPSSTNIQRAVNALIEVKALTATEQITSLGRLLSKLPMDVHLGKFLLQSVILGSLDSALTICATLNAKSPFLRPFGFETQADAAKSSFAKENSDFLALVNAFNSWKRAVSNAQHIGRKFCRESYLSYQNLQQIEDLRQQFMGYLIDSSFVNIDAEFSQEFKRIRFQRRGAKFMELPASLSSPDTNVGLVQAALTAGMFPKIISIDFTSGQMQTISNNRPIAFHPSSVNFRKDPREFKQSKKLYASETGPANDLSLILLCGDCEFKPASELVIVDRKLKYRVSGKNILVLKALKAKLASNMTVRLRSRQPDVTSEAEIWSTFALDLFRSPTTS